MFRKKVPLAGILDGLYDTHCHILPAVDDGARNIEGALRLLKRMEELGMRGAYLTPHIISGLYGNRDEEELRRHFADFSHGSTLDIRLAAEYFADERFAEHVAGSPLTMGGDHLLVELSMNSYSESSFETLFEASMSGFDIILAHPERYVFIQNDRKGQFLERILNSRYKLQLNLLSVTGYHGQEAQRAAERLLKEGHYTFVGTDAHSQTYYEAISRATVSPKIYSQLEELRENNKTLFG